MMKYLFTNVVANLRSNGGEAEVFVHLTRAKEQPTLGEQVHYDDATAQVEFLIPFTFSGEELCVVARGVYCAEEDWKCFTEGHRKAKIEMALDEATKCAIMRAKDEIGVLLKKVRPTVSSRKKTRKTRAILKLLHHRNLAP